MDVLALLRSKNKCLKQFLELTTEFCAVAEKGELAGLPQFESKREHILKAMDLYDRKLAEAIAQMDDSQRTPELVEKVKKALEIKETLVKQIIELDLRIIAKIEEAKAQILKDMASNRKSMDKLSKFKSTWVSESGEELDQKL